MPSRFAPAAETPFSRFPQPENLEFGCSLNISSGEQAQDQQHEENHHENEE
jgi:hypothetical protein